jgi:hypothetical protein
MRRHWPNLLTSVVTVALLAVLTLPALHVGPARDRSVLALAAQDPPPARTFGVYVDPWHLDDWAAAVGAAPRMVAKFEAF